MNGSREWHKKHVNLVNVPTFFNPKRKNGNLEGFRKPIKYGNGLNYLVGIYLCVYLAKLARTSHKSPKPNVDIGNSRFAYRKSYGVRLLAFVLGILKHMPATSYIPFQLNISIILVINTLPVIFFSFPTFL